jgi:branched-chain amino acid transport system substrate-binding protein
LGNLLKQSKQLGVTAPYFVPDEAEDPTVLKIAGEAAEGIKTFAPSPSATNPEFIAFRERFLKKYNQEPTTLSANSYDATILVGQALSKCKRDKTCIQKELYSTSHYNGVSGIFSINSDGDTEKPFLLKEVKNGKFVTID